MRYMIPTVLIALMMGLPAHAGQDVADEAMSTGSDFVRFTKINRAHVQFWMPAGSMILVIEGQGEHFAGGLSTGPNGEFRLEILYDPGVYTNIQRPNMLASHKNCTFLANTHKDGYTMQGPFEVLFRGSKPGKPAAQTIVDLAGQKVSRVVLQLNNVTASDYYSCGTAAP